jgi:hypothetical protein
MSEHDLYVLAGIVGVMLAPWAIFELMYWWTGVSSSAFGTQHMAFKMTF